MSGFPCQRGAGHDEEAARSNRIQWQIIGLDRPVRRGRIKGDRKTIRRPDLEERERRPSPGTTRSQSIRTLSAARKRRTNPPCPSSPTHAIRAVSIPSRASPVATLPPNPPTVRLNPDTRSSRVSVSFGGKSALTLPMTTTSGKSRVTLTARRPFVPQCEGAPTNFDPLSATSARGSRRTFANAAAYDSISSRGWIMIGWASSQTMIDDSRRSIALRYSAGSTRPDPGARLHGYPCPKPS